MDEQTFADVLCVFFLNVHFFDLMCLVKECGNVFVSPVEEVFLSSDNEHGKDNELFYSLLFLCCRRYGRH